MSAAPNVAQRLRRLLAILTWLAQVGEAPIDEAAARFGLDPATLVAELEMAACCGIPPYTPDQLMEIVVTDTTVSAHLAEYVARPRRLSAREGFALAASARALLAVAGSDANGALSRALAKLEDALGGDPVVVELDTPAMWPAVNRALHDRQLLEIEYYSASTDEVSNRRIDPIRMFAAGGHWYVDAYCHRAGDERRFRVDRIRSAIPSDGGARVAVPAVVTDGAGVADDFAPFVPGPDVRFVRLSLGRSVAWMVESVPAVGPPIAVGDRIEVEVAVGGNAWLDRLLLRLGTAAQVLAPAADAGRLSEAAARILEVY